MFLFKYQNFHTYIKGFLIKNKCFKILNYLTIQTLFKKAAEPRDICSIRIFHVFIGASHRNII